MTMVDITQKLPLELLAEVLGYASASDLVRFKQVKRHSLVVDELVEFT